MAEVIAEALVGLRADGTGFERDAQSKIRSAVEKAEKSTPPISPGVDTSKLSASVSAATAALGALASGVVVQKTLQTVQLLANAASDLAEAQSAANTQFGEGAALVDRFSSSAATSLGISKTAALDASTAFGGMFQNIGLAADESARLSTGAVQLAGDLASFRNLRVDDALTKIQAGLAGEAEPLRRFGVDISDAAVQAKALQLGLIDAHGELNQGQKVLVRYQLILEQLKTAEGDAQRTGDGYANTQRRLQAVMQDFEATVGQTLLPTLSALAANLAVVVAGADRLARVLGTGGLGNIIKIFAEASGFLNPVLDEMGKKYSKGADAADIYAETQKAIADSVNEATNGIDAQNEALGRQVDAVFASLDAQLAQLDAHKAQENAQKAVTDAERDYQDALSGSGKYADAARQAAEKLANAQQSLARAQERVKELTWDLSDAQAAYTEAVFHFGPGSKQAIEASRNIEKAQFDLKDANDSVKAATDDVTDAQDASAKAANRQQAIADAADKLKDARDKLERSTYAATKSDQAFGDALDTVNGKTKTASERAIAERDALELLAKSLGPSSPLAKGLQDRIAQLDRMIQQAGDLAGILNLTLIPALGALQLAPPGTVTTPGLAPGAVGSGGLAPGAIGSGDTGGGAVGAGGLQASGGNTVVFQYPVPPDQVAAYVESATRVPN